MIAAIVVFQEVDIGTLQTIDYTIAEPSQLSDADKAKVEKIYQRLVRPLSQRTQEERNYSLLFRDMPSMGRTPSRCRGNGGDD